MGLNLFGSNVKKGGTPDPNAQKAADDALTPPPPPPPTTLTTDAAATAAARLAADVARKKGRSGSLLLGAPGSNVSPAQAVTTPRTLIGS